MFNKFIPFTDKFMNQVFLSSVEYKEGTYEISVNTPNQNRDKVYRKHDVVLSCCEMLWFA